MSEFMKGYFKGIEQSIAKLTKTERAIVYKECGQNCAKYGVLAQYENLYKDASGNMDEVYLRMHEIGDVVGRVIKSNSEYEIEFPRCLCPLYQEGYLTTNSHCECSRQSILYVLNRLYPEKNIEVKLIETVLGGSRKCVFKVLILE